MSEQVNFLFLAAAYGVFWFGTFGYVFAIARRQQSLERELEALKRRMTNVEWRVANDE